MVGHRIHHVVQPVVQVDIRAPGRALERRVTHCAAGRGMTSGVVFADVRFDFDDAAGGRAVLGSVDEDLADQVAGNVERGARIEICRQDHGSGKPSSAR